MTRRRPFPPRDPSLSDAELEDALRRFFDADPDPEIATMPTELLAEVARRERKREEVAQQATGP